MMNKKSPKNSTPIILYNISQNLSKNSLTWRSIYSIIKYTRKGYKMNDNNKIDLKTYLEMSRKRLNLSKEQFVEYLGLSRAWLFIL